MTIMSENTWHKKQNEYYFTSQLSF